MLIVNERDTRLMTIYSNARLIVYDWHFNLYPDILKSYEVEEGRVFTLKLRAGHKWSDGHPFTTEDFHYFWKDIANNKELSPSGPSVELLVDGQPPKVEILDEVTIRYTWDKPNPYFIESQARAAPLWLYRPAHYLKKFHIKYAPRAEIAEAARSTLGSDLGGNWVQIHRSVDAMYYDSNPGLPTLNPWVQTTRPPAQRFVYTRNPYYYRIDREGHQLPYFDHVIFSVVGANLVPTKAGPSPLAQGRFAAPKARLPAAGRLTPQPQRRQTTTDQRALATPAGINRNPRPASIGIRWPTSFGMPGRLHRNPQLTGAWNP
jgi:peptide/nickel transport system substrate-binding protein